MALLRTTTTLRQRGTTCRDQTTATDTSSFTLTTIGTGAFILSTDFETRKVAHVDMLDSQVGNATYRMQLYLHLVFPRDSLHSQEFLEPCTSIEAAKTAHLGAAVGKIRLVVDGHIVDVDGT